MIVLCHGIILGMKDAQETGSMARVIAGRFDRILIDGILFDLVVAGGDDDQVHARSTHLVLNRRLGSAAESDHGEHGGHTDGHADHGQRGLQFILAQRLDSDLETLAERHYAFSSMRIGISTISARAVRRRSLIWSDTTTPSLKATMREPYAATSGSWVIRTMVMPRVSFNDWKISITSTLVRLSRLPVGSSASRIEGLFNRARAMATRCCWPPESWFVWCCARSASPTAA